MSGPFRLPAGNRFVYSLWILLACLVAYANIYGNDFVWDDLDFIVKNYELRGFFPLTKFFLSTSTIPQRPVMGLSLALDFRLWGLNPAGFHLTQVLLHSAIALLVSFLFYRLFRSLLGSLLSGLLFALHPVHGEAVTAFLGRSELAMAFFGLLAVAAFLAHRHGPARWRWAAYGASLVAYSLSCLSKETGIVFPFLLGLILMLCPSPPSRRDAERSLILRLLPFGGVAFLYLLYHRSVAWDIVRPWWGGGPYHSGLMMLTVAWDYARLLVFPLHLSPWYIVPVPGSFWEWKVILGGILLAGSLALVVFLRRRAWILSLSLGWIFISLLPVSNLIPIPGSMMAERWLYLSSVGFCWGAGGVLAMGYERLREKSPARKLAVLFFLVLCGLALVRLWTWNRVWHNGERLFRTMLSRTDENPLAHGNLGDFYLDRGRLREAARQYAATLFYAPRSPRAAEGLGAACLAQGLNAEALVWFRRALAIDPEFTQARYSMGLALAALGDTSSALGALQGVIRKEPYNPAPNEAVGILLLKAGRPQEALGYFERALAMRPKDPELHFQAGQAWAALGRWGMAEKAYLQALALPPRSEKAYEALLDLYEREGRTADAVSLRKRYGGPPASAP